MNHLSERHGPLLYTEQDWLRQCTNLVAVVGELAPSRLSSILLVNDA
jgi:hypothetical protein